MEKNLFVKMVKTLFYTLVFSIVIGCYQSEQADNKVANNISEPPLSDELLITKSSITPASGSTLTTTSVTFNWDHPGEYYYIEVGTSVGAKDIFATENYFQSKSYTVNNLPTSGKIYVRISYYDWNNSQWLYSDYNYTMSIHQITPASNTTLTESSVQFTWTHQADYYRLYLGTTSGSDNLYDSGNLTTQSHIVKNIPGSGTVYLRLWLYKNGSWSENYDFTYIAKAGNGEKDFIITAVNDDLNPSDMIDFANGLKSIGYTQELKDSNVSTSELKSYIERNVKTLYHTGHGYDGYISTSNGGLYVSSLNSVAVENLIIATCLTLKDRSWKNKFSSTTKNIMGYTNNSFDNVDNRVAKNMTDKLKNGKSYLQAWYEVNSVESYLYDRWCCYTRSGNSVVEYSADSGNTPKASSFTGSFYSLANGKLLVSSEVGNTVKSNSIQFNNRYNAKKYQRASIVKQDLETLVNCNISKQEAIERAKNWITSKGIFDQAELDKVISLYANKNVIGYQVRFKRIVNSLPIRGNALTDYISLLVTDKEIISRQYNWSSISQLLQKSTVKVISATKAIELAAEAIVSMYKGNNVKIIKSVPCLGFKINKSGTNKLIPAYELISSDGSGIVINAVNGNIL